MSVANTNEQQKESGAGAQRVLVWIVVSMGFALVGGSALLIGKIVNKSEECTLEVLALPQASRIIGADSDQVIVQTEAGNLQFYGLCRGAMLREIAVK